MRPSSPSQWSGSTWLLGIAALAVLSIALGSVLWGLSAFPGGLARSGQGSVDAAVIGYVPYWDQRRAFDVIREHPDMFDEVSPVWYSLEPSGEVVLTDPRHTTIDRATVNVLQDNGIKVIPTVTSLRDGQWQPELVRDMLHDTDAVRHHVRQLVALAITEGYDGIDVDYEDLRADDRDAFSAFLTKLAQALHEQDLLLTVAVHAKASDGGYDERNRAQDYHTIGEVADQVRLMTYDYSWGTSPPGPVAPAYWVEEVVAWTVTQVPPEKVVLGIALVGYDWSGQRGESIVYDQALETKRAQDATLQRADDYSPWFRYEDGGGAIREVWFEDAASVAVKLDLVHRYELGGTFFWRLGGEDPRVWQTVRDRL